MDPCQAPYTTTNGNMRVMIPLPFLHTYYAVIFVKAHNVVRVLPLLLSVPLSLVFYARPYIVRATEGDVQIAFDINRGQQVELLSGGV